MKRFLTALMAASAIFALNSCTEDTPVEDGPSIEWKSNSDFSTVDITETMDVNLTIKAPAGIKSFTVKVDSEPLNNGEGLLNGFKLSELDLVNPSEETAFIVTMILGEGQTVADATELNLDLSTLVPLIAGLTTEDGYHSFTLNIVDNNAKSLEKTCRFHRIGEDTPSYAEPTMIWDGNENFDVEEIEEGMTVKFTINVPAGIESLVVDINSPALNPIGITSLDFVNVENNGTLAGVVTGILGDQDITTATVLTLDLSTLMPMLLGLPTLTPDSDHVFTVKLTDKAGQGLEQACTFHYTGETTPALSVDESSVDLWANTVKLNVSGEVTSVAYREKDTETWIEVKADENGEYIVAPVWNEGQNEAGLTVYTPKAGTGIFAGKTYEFQLNGETVADAELTTDSGDVIPNGDMFGWSKVQREGLFTSANVDYPNASTENSFWDCGNNGVTTTLCVPDKEKFGTAAPGAHMKSTNMFVLAAGNLFTGDFYYENMTGTVHFGKKYSYKARPRALKLQYNAVVGNIDLVRTSGDIIDGVSKGDPDNARIFVAIVDWSEQHQVVSEVETTKGSWDPEKGADVVSEGKILGYGSFTIQASESGLETDALKDKSIDIVWYDKIAKPTEGNYSIVISCACNFYGDYFTGCSTNQMWVDDFEWVY